MPIFYGHESCKCSAAQHELKFVALTGGPGGGKTAVLESAARTFCRHVAVLPESASIIFGGGFPRYDSRHGKAACQRAIFHIQREMEKLIRQEDEVALVLCDRGTIDGVAYWPGDAESYWAELGTSQEEELSHYDAVVHLETPGEEHGYNHDNALRIESALTAKEIDKSIEEAWGPHPRRSFIPSTRSFLDKVQSSLEAIREHVPACCLSGAGGSERL